MSVVDMTDKVRRHIEHGDEYETPGQVINQTGFTVVRNDHYQRIITYAQRNDADAAALLGLYLHMAQKPPGWRFSAERIGRELNRGRKSILPLLRHLKALGHYGTRNVRQDDGTIRQMTWFDPGVLWPMTSPESLPESPPPESPRRDSGPTSEKGTFPQVAPESPYRHSGDRHSGEGTRQSVLRVTTESQSVSQSVESPPDEPPTGGDDVTDLTAVMDMLDPRIRPTPTRQLAEYLRWATQRGWHADQLRDHISRNVNPDKAGPGAVVALIKNLGQPPADHQELSDAARHPSSQTLPEALSEDYCDHGSINGRCPMCRVTRLASEKAMPA